MTKTAKRLAIYVYFDKEGVAKNYALYYISHLKEVSEKILVVNNGSLLPKEKEKFQSLGVEVLVRPNEGFDFSAWSYAFGQLGWKEIENYDEVILCNSSCYGPVSGSFSPLFDKMDGVKADFWSITEYEDPPISIPYHLQSYFLVFRQNLIKNHTFKQYWKNIPISKTWKEAVDLEKNFTNTLIKLGFTPRAYLTLPKGDNPYIFSLELLRAGNPLVKRKIFTDGFKEFSFLTAVREPCQIFDFLKGKNYPTDFIIEDLLTSVPPSVIRETFHLTFVLDDARKSSDQEKKQGIALIFFVYFEDLVEECLRYIRHMPKDSAIYIVSSKKQLLEEYKKRMQLDQFNIKDFRLQPNRGRCEAAFFTTCKDVWSEQELICLAHDKKTPSAINRLVGPEFMNHCLFNLLPSAIYIENVLTVFKENPYIGLLEPPPPFFGAWKTLPLDLWGQNKKKAEFFMEKTKLPYIFDPYPIAPFGGMMWVRSQAFKSLLRLNLKTEDYPKEPLPPDGSILHALERLYPTIAQQNGFVTGWVINQKYAGLYVDNLAYHIVHSYRTKLSLKRRIANELRNYPMIYRLCRWLYRKLLPIKQ